MSEVILLRISISRTLRRLQRRDNGLQEDGSIGDLDIFRIWTIFPRVRMLGMVFCLMDRLKKSFRARMTTGPTCFTCLYEMSSGPTK